MAWFVARLLYENTMDGETLREESYRLISGVVDDTERLATEVGRDNMKEYLNESGETVTWEFREVLEIFEVGDESLEHGTEIFSRMDWESE